ELALEGVPDAAPALRGKALLGLADLALGVLDFQTASTAARESLELARQASDVEALGRALTMVGQVELFLDPGGARSTFDEALEVARRAEDLGTVSDALGGLAGTSFFLGDFAGAEDFARQAIDVARVAD